MANAQSWRLFIALSLMASAAAAPFFLLTLPAGAVADIANRRVVIISVVLWRGNCSALLALGAWTHVINANSVLACIFALGIGLAFFAPVWGAIVPDIVDKEELPSAITLGGVQLNLSGIVGPGSRRTLVADPWRSSAYFGRRGDLYCGCSCGGALEASPGANADAPRKFHRVVYQLAALRAPFARG